MLNINFSPFFIREINPSWSLHEEIHFELESFPQEFSVVNIDACCLWSHVRGVSNEGYAKGLVQQRVRAVGSTMRCNLRFNIAVTILLYVVQCHYTAKGNNWPFAERLEVLVHNLVNRSLGRQYFSRSLYVFALSKPSSEHYWAIGAICFLIFDS